MKLGSKQKQKKILIQRCIIGGLLLVSVFLLVSVVKRYTIEQDMAGRRSVVESERDALLERKEALKERVEYLADERSIEAEIRRSFDVAKEGEQVVVILDEPDSTPVTEEVAPETDEPWYKFW